MPRTACALGLALALAVGASANVATAATSVAAERAKAVKLEATMQRMRADLALRMAEYASVAGDLARTRGDIAGTTARLRVIDRALAHDQLLLAGRAVRIYMSGPVGFLEVALHASTFDDFLTRWRFVSSIAAEDAQVIGRVKRLRAENVRLTRSLREREARLAALRNRAAAEQTQLRSSIIGQQAKLHSVDTRVASLLRQRERAAVNAPSGGGAPRDNSITWRGTGGSWMSASSLVPGASASVDGYSGASFTVPSGQATHYASTGISWDGVASYYGGSGGTASGRHFSGSELTCAHKTLPFGTLLAVSKGGHHVIVVVTDRGPYISGRDLDLSETAAGILGVDGVGSVHEEIVVPAS
jgi:rare lipoprotein A